MRRRDVVTFLGGATAWVAAARAQEPRRVIGVLSSASYGAFPGSEAAFIQGLKAAGFLEGKNISIEWRWADGQYNRLSSLADELVRRDVAVIATFDVPSSLAATAATKTIPIVFFSGADPVRLGLVDSFNQPRRNLTGVTSLLSSLGAKQLELVHELLPGLSEVAFLVNPVNANSLVDVSEIQAAADALGQHLEVVTASTENELDTAFATMVRQRVSALMVKPDPFFILRCERLVALAARYAMPAIYSLPLFVRAGGLLSYGGTLQDSYQQEGVYVGKILRGAKPADLPIQQNTKFDLAINLKTAKTLGLTIPPSLLVRADEVIE
jgi:putative tryptophan/tyrosine transport system substrate-binding protein